MRLLNFKKGKPAENNERIKGTNKDEFFAVLISPLIKDVREKNIEARTITVKQTGDAQIIITNADNQPEDALDRVLFFLGSRFNPITAGKEILAFDPLVERIFVRKSLPEPVEYPVFDESGKPSRTAVLKNPLVIIARKGLRTLTRNEEKDAADRLYIPIRVNMAKEMEDKLVNSLYRHPAVRLLTKAGILRHIGVNPDTGLMEVVISQLVPGYPSPAVYENKSGEMIYVWMEITDRKYYNKILTQICEIINDFAFMEMKSSENSSELEVKSTVFMTRTGVGGELCSQILLSGSGCLFTSFRRKTEVTLPAERTGEINSLGIVLRPNSDL